MPVTFEVTVVKPVAPTVAHEREARALRGDRWSQLGDEYKLVNRPWSRLARRQGYRRSCHGIGPSNGLSGEIPDALGNLSNLEYLASWDK